MTSRAFSVEFADHKALIWKFARKGYARALALRLPLNDEDVFQEMCVTYTKAREKWNPNFGVSFSAYLGQSIWNDWNKRVKQMTASPALISTDEIDARLRQDDTLGANNSVIDVISIEEATPDPLETRIHAEFVLEQIKPMSRLVKLVIAELLSTPGEKITTRSVATKYGFAEADVKRARKEMRKKWGVSI